MGSPTHLNVGPPASAGSRISNTAASMASISMRLRDEPLAEAPAMPRSCIIAVALAGMRGRMSQPSPETVILAPSLESEKDTGTPLATTAVPVFSVP